MLNILWIALNKYMYIGCIVLLMEMLIGTDPKIDFKNGVDLFCKLMLQIITWPYQLIRYDVPYVYNKLVNKYYKRKLSK